MREVAHSDNVAPSSTRRRHCVPTPASCLPACLRACHPGQAQSRPASASASLPAVAQLPGVSASARHERCMSPLWSTIAPVIGPLACRCTAYRLSVDPNFFKKSRGRFSLLKGPSSVSILFSRYSSRRNQIFVLTFQSSNCCPASPTAHLHCLFSRSFSQSGLKTFLPKSPATYHTPPFIMSPLQPVALFGLEVPPGDILVPVSQSFPATVSTKLLTPAICKCVKPRATPSHGLLLVQSLFAYTLIHEG